MTNEKIAKKILKTLKEKTKKKCVSFTLKKGKTGLFDNKISGVPFMPKGGEYPVSTTSGEKLHLLIQLNFGTLPHIENYPKKGILQIFIEATDVYGANFEDPQEQDSWRIIYYKDIANPMSEDEILALMPEVPEDCYELPFEETGKEYKLEFKEEEMSITSNCFDFDDICEDALDGELDGKTWADLPEEVTDEIYEELYGEGTRLGGYPGFTQSDPREGAFENYELLLQIDSEGDDTTWYLMWGDAGIANFFIDPEDLKKCDFSNVIYNWDCC